MLWDQVRFWIHGRGSRTVGQRERPKQLLRLPGSGALLMMLQVSDEEPQPELKSRAQ